MTRVNLVGADTLYDQHLMAEYREIPMVIGSLKRSLKSVDYDLLKLRKRIPETFALNSGHVTFFYDKGEWLHRRFTEVVFELKERNFNIDPNSRNIKWGVFIENNLWFNNWLPSEGEILLSKERIEERVSQKPDWYRKTPVYS